jgi:hypothetical protein
MGFTYTESKNLPIYQRKWFIQRIQTEMNDANGQSKAAHTNDTTSRAMAGNSRQTVPAKLRRFT